MDNYNGENGVWRTISGRKVFIKNGQSLQSAMAESGKFQDLSIEQENYFKNSKARDNQGNLVEVYHGTNNEFTEFDKKTQGSNFSYSEGGFFFTNKESSAKSFGKNIIKSYVNIENPFVRKSPGLISPMDFFDSHDFINEAQSEEHDGIIIKGSGDYEGEDLFIAFEPNQIKNTTNKKPSANNDINK